MVKRTYLFADGAPSASESCWECYHEEGGVYVCRLACGQAAGSTKNMFAVHS